MNEWKRVLATHEEYQELSTGNWLGYNYPGVALPSSKALYKWIILRFKDRWTCARVMDVGPWCIDDDLYVFTGERPRAEIFKDQLVKRSLIDNSKATLPDGTICEKSNGAGIDLFPYTAKCLGISMDENVWVEWKWVELVSCD